MATWAKLWRWLRVEQRSEERGSDGAIDPAVHRLRAMGLLSGAPQTEEVKRVLELMRARDTDEARRSRKNVNTFEA